MTLPAHEEQAPARHEYGRSMPASCATREETHTRENRQSMRPRARVNRTRVKRKDSRDDGWISIAIAIDPARDSNAFARALATVLRIDAPRDGCTHKKKFVSRVLASRVESRASRRVARTSAASRMYVSSAHSMACAPSGVSKVTVYRARTEPRAILAPAVRRAATRTGARTAVAEETVKADMIPGESGCEEVFRSRSIETTRARAWGRGWELGFWVYGVCVVYSTCHTSVCVYINVFMYYGRGKLPCRVGV